MKKRKIRVRNGFSDRNIIDYISKEMQFLDFSLETRVVLFNSIKNNLEFQIESQNLNVKYIVKSIVECLFNDVYDSYNDNYSTILEDIYGIILNEEYHVVLTTVEYLCNLVYESREHYANRHGNDWYYMNKYINIYEQLNMTFENEYIGYRFIDEKIVPITNNSEIVSINESLKTPYEKVNELIGKSISFISETGVKDYKNSIKESITALEELINILNNSEGLTLSNALEQLCLKISVNAHLKESIKALYKYASDVDGVRHGNNKDNGDISFDEAKFVLLICSASINYLCTLDDYNDLLNL